MSNIVNFPGPEPLEVFVMVGRCDGILCFRRGVGGVEIGFETPLKHQSEMDFIHDLIASASAEKYWRLRYIALALDIMGVPTENPVAHGRVVRFDLRRWKRLPDRVLQ